MQIPTERKPWYRVLYIQVLIAVFLGIVVGYVNPGLGKNLKPLGDGFVSLVKMIIAPIIFCTVVHGIASMSDMRRVSLAPRFLPVSLIRGLEACPLAPFRAA
jgi:aerobic C4-dicarboxylate transport protein